MLHYGEVRHWPPWAEILSRLNHFLLSINSSSNIIIYVAKVSKTLHNHKTSLNIYRISSSGVLSYWAWHAGRRKTTGDPGGEHPSPWKPLTPVPLWVTRGKILWTLSWWRPPQSLNKLCRTNKILSQNPSKWCPNVSQLDSSINYKS